MVNSANREGEFLDPRPRETSTLAAGAGQVPLHRLAYVLVASPLIAITMTFVLCTAIDHFAHGSLSGWATIILLFNALLAAVGCGAAGFLSHHDVTQRVQRTFINLILGFLSYWVLLAIAARMFRL